MIDIKKLQKALAMSGFQVDAKSIAMILAVAQAFIDKGGEYSLKDAAKIEAEIDEAYKKKPCQYEYAIIPISFKDYNEYVDGMNELGKDGWIVKERIDSYYDSPQKGITTADHICLRHKK